MADIMARLRRVTRRNYDRLRLRLSIRHLHGPRQLTLGPQDVTLVSLIRDAEYFLLPLLEHHRALGIRHFVFIDNGSTDRTLQILSEQADCTVIQSRLPAKRFEMRMRSYAARRFCTGHWCLFVDSDEMVDLPFGLSATAFAQYLDQHGYTGVLAAMLDLFPPGDLAQLSGLTYPQAIAAFRRYSLNDITKVPYFDRSGAIGFYRLLESNTVDLDDPHMMFGGIRAGYFGETCCLSKHPMLKVTGKVSFDIHPHSASNLSCADASLLIRHYKFAGKVLERTRASVQEGTWSHGEDVRRLQKLDAETAIVLDSPAARTLSNPDQLWDEGFLTASPRLRRFAEERHAPVPQDRP